MTGATGLVGNNCVRALDADHDVQVLVRTEHDNRPFEGRQVTKHLGDLSRPQSLVDVVPDADIMIHAAGDTHIGHYPRPHQWTVNTDAATALARIAHQRGMRYVFVSSVDALPAGAPNRLVDESTIGEAKCNVDYVRSKRTAERELEGLIAQGLDAVIVNPGFMLGPWDWKPSSGRMLLEVATRFTPFGPRGGFSVCDVRDVASAICRIATEPTAHRRYILAGHNVRYVDAWRVFAEISGGRPPVGRAGPLALTVAGYWGDLLARLTGSEGDVNSGTVQMSKLFHYYDSSRAQHELGYTIRPLAETVADAWRWFQTHGYVGKPG